MNRNRRQEIWLSQRLMYGRMKQVIGRRSNKRVMGSGIYVRCVKGIVLSWDHGGLFGFSG